MRSDISDFPVRLLRSIFLVFLIAVLLGVSAGQNSFCDEIGADSECIQKNDRQLDDTRYRFSYVFEMREKSSFKSLNGRANFQIFNLTLISGTWRGSFNISSNNTKIQSGAEFIPENGNILIGTELPEGDITFPDSSVPAGCQDVKYDNRSATSGVYQIDPDGQGGISPFNVYCEMNSNGGWMKLEMSGTLDKQNGGSFGCGSENNIFIFTEASDWSEWTGQSYWNQDNPIPFSRMDHIDDSTGTGDGEEFCSGDTLDKFNLKDEGEEYDDRPTEFTRMDIDYITTGASTGRLTESQENTVRLNVDHLSPQTQVFSATSDDDNCNYNGEWFIYASDNGQNYHLTPWSTGSETGVNDDWGKHNTGSGNTGGHGYTFSNGNFSMPAQASAYNGAADDCSGPSTWGIFGYEKGYALVQDLARSCVEIQERMPKADSGQYRIDPDGAGGIQPFKTYCDMSTDGGGWTRINHSVAQKLGISINVWSGSADVAAFDSQNRPYVQDGSGDFSARIRINTRMEYSEFYLSNFKAEGTTSNPTDVDPTEFVYDEWSDDYGGNSNYWGDFAFGTPAKSVPETSFAQEGQTVRLEDGQTKSFAANGQVFETGVNSSAFRMQFGEGGGDEGFKWNAGSIYIR